jgi:two-component system, NtrC family, sensor kinase
MRLATKLTLAVVLIMVAVFAFRAYQSAQREVARAQADLREDHFIIGRALRPAIREVWRLEGRQRALQVLDIADERIQRARMVRIAWMPIDPTSAAHQRLLGADGVARLRTGEEATVVRVDGDTLKTFVPMQVGSHVEGAFEISEPLTAFHQRQREEVRVVLERAGLGAAASILAISLLGFVLVGRPMRRLADFAKRIGAGDLNGTLSVHQRDEIGELAAEMNHMCRRLRAADQQLREETAARIRALEQLRHADRLTTVGTLASGIAHELGTPLNVVSGRAKMVTTGEARGTEAAACCQVIVEQVGRMAGIIRQLLDFARRRSPDRGPQSLRSLSEQTLDLLRPMAMKRGVRLALEEEQPALEAEVDGGQVQQALTNLVVNGIQAMPSGGCLTVRVGCADETPPPDVGGDPGPFAQVVVQDEGPGIAPELIPRVFEPFFTTKDVGEGTGLGLSVAHGIARDHGGWIAVESELGKGTRFALHLPVRQTQRGGHEGPRAAG